MASFNKFHCFVENLAEKVHNLGADTLKLYLSNAAPDAAGNLIKTDLAEIASGNGYPAGGLSLTVASSSQSGGVYSLVINDPAALVAGGGTIGPFRYAILYNDTPTSPADPLIGWWDYGSSITLADGESLTLDFSSSLTLQ